MMAAIKGKAAATADSWSAWLDQLDHLQEERAEITGMADANQRLEGAQRRINYLCGQAWNSSLMPADLDRAAMRGDESAQNVRAVLRGENGDPGAAATHLLGLLSRATHSLDWRNQSQERRAFIQDLATKLREALAALEKGRDDVARLEQIRGEVDQRLEDLEAKAPKASASSLASLLKERDAATKDRERLVAALNNMTADDSPLSLAREAERAAQERFEEAEALLAMGEANAEEVKAAKAEADKASKSLEQKQAEHRSQDAARRGMARKLEQADSRLETLSRAYRQALGRVRHAELADLEGKLVEQVEALEEHLAGMGRIYADLEEAEPESSYGRAVIEIKLPYLHHHPRADELHNGLTITAHGREE
ncbi:hypothetical protein BWR19_15875 [Halomonas sp. 1513]|nr:hypothetical protein BWR19_15875 [Halomonas sp. 1513]